MEEKELNIPKIDLIFLLRIWLRYAKRFWAMALVLAVLGAGVLGLNVYRNHVPMYEASVSFLVRVANPLYAGMHGYNNATASQLNATFPYILRSAILQQRVKEHLGVDSIPYVTTTVLPNSNIFTMKVQAPDPEWANTVLDAVVECYPQVADYVVGATELLVLDRSGVPTRPIREVDLTDSLMFGAAAGVALWMAFVLLLTLRRRTIHN